jgi:hypothetical protein
MPPCSALLEFRLEAVLESKIPRDASPAVLLLEFRLEAVPELKIPPQGGTPTANLDQSQIFSHSVSPKPAAPINQFSLEPTATRNHGRSPTNILKESMGASDHVILAPRD